MHHKNIKRLVKKQIKKEHPNWKLLSKKEKREASRQIAQAVIDDYDFKQEIEAPMEELVGIEGQLPNDDIIPLPEMDILIDDFYKNSLIDVRKIKRLRTHLKDGRLKFIDGILDNAIINRLLSYKGYTPSMRTYLPSDFLRAELLKAIKYPEIAYRKYCTKEYLGLDRKENREFIGLPLHKKQIISHCQLSQFRSSLTFAQSINLLVYAICLFQRSGILKGNVLHGIDSTELYNDNARPLFTMNVRNKKIRVYGDLDCDCGKRRNKRNKSQYFIGYRLHTLTVIDPETGHSFPLVSLVAPGNHHDSLFLKPLVELAQAMGIDMKLITADEAYHDKDASLFNDTGVTVITPPASGTQLPENIDPETLTVTLGEECEIPMRRVGCMTSGHEYKCNAAAGECPKSIDCVQHRVIPFDDGVFQRIPVDSEQAQKAIDIRKNIERPYNLLKHREGLEQIRVRSQKALISKCAITTMATLLIEIERRCNNLKAREPQLRIFDIAS